MNTRKIIFKFTKAWEDNECSDFMNLIAEDALIYHPYFKEPITAMEAMEVMNTAVSGTSKVEDYKLLEGNGDGNNDKVRLEMCDTGTQIKDIHYVGLMPLLITITKGKITEITIEKGRYKTINEAKLPKRGFPKKYKIEKCFNQCSSLAVLIKLARFWGQNHKAECLSLFSDTAKARHVLYEEETTPLVLIDVMNSNVLGTTELYGFEIIKGDGSGRNDMVRAKFIETGDLIGYTPELQGVMNITLNIINSKIIYLDVEGYDMVNIGGNVDEEINRR